jgi:hypothetical protein
VLSSEFKSCAFGFNGYEIFRDACQKTNLDVLGSLRQSQQFQRQQQWSARRTCLNINFNIGGGCLAHQAAQ